MSGRSTLHRLAGMLRGRTGQARAIAARSVFPPLRTPLARPGRGRRLAALAAAAGAMALLAGIALVALDRHFPPDLSRARFAGRALERPAIADTA